MNSPFNMLNKSFVAVTSFLIMFFSMSVSADHMSAHSIEKRISSVGSVCVEGEECKAAEVEVVEAPKGPRSGEEIVQNFCVGCHATGVMNAPKIGSSFTALSSKGMPALLKVAKKGKNAMPRKGGCNDCSEEELSAAIQNMLDQ